MPSLLILGGTGFVSGTLARTALDHGWSVTAVTRGQRFVPSGIDCLQADRTSPSAFASTLRSAAPTLGWDLAVDCIGMQPEHARQDLDVFTGLARHLVFISSDSVFDPARRKFPQPEHGTYLCSGYGGGKRACEEVLLAAGTRALSWTVLRPGHIYGPGSQLGCLPRHVRDVALLDKLRRREPLRLVCGGRFLQQPVYAGDLAAVILATVGNPHAIGVIAQVPGPELIESRHYYEIIARHLGVELMIEDEPVELFLSIHPELAGFCCHRIPTTQALIAAQLPLPTTPINEGLARQIKAMQTASN